MSHGGWSHRLLYILLSRCMVNTFLNVSVGNFHQTNKTPYDNLHVGLGIGIGALPEVLCMIKVQHIVPLVYFIK